MATLKNTSINDTGYIKVPTGTKTQRPDSPSTGYLRFNTDIDEFEFYNGTDWLLVGYEGIPTDGLTLYLDAGNRKSYDGEGTTWFDLSGNRNHAQLSGSIDYSVDDGGKIDYRGVSQTTNYVSMPINVLQDSGTIYTMVMWIQPVNEGTRYFNSVSSTASGNNAGIIEIASNNISSWLGGSSVSFTNNEFLQLTLIRNGSNSGTLRKNIDSTVSATLYDLTTANGWVLNQEQDSVIGGFDPNQNAYAAFSVYLFYNRALSASEVTQIYNYFKGRYGL